MRARIRKLVLDRGFGFAILNETADDVFIHKNQCRPRAVFDEFEEGVEVEISKIISTDRGYRAEGVSRATS